MRVWWEIHRSRMPVITHKQRNDCTSLHATLIQCISMYIQCRRTSSCRCPRQCLSPLNSVDLRRHSSRLFLPSSTSSSFSSSASLCYLCPCCCFTSRLLVCSCSVSILGVWEIAGVRIFLNHKWGRAQVAQRDNVKAQKELIIF